MKAAILKYSTGEIVENIDSAIETILGDELPILTQLKKFTIESGGKRVRSILAFYLAELYGKPDKEIYTLGALVELVHAASLLHDDVLDNADVRRGKPSGKRIFGSKQVILGGDYILACVIRRLNKYKTPELIDVFTRTIKDLSVSELLQMEYENSSKTTLEIYNKIISGKTASLFCTACESIAIFTGQSPQEIEKISQFGKKLGILFQIRDDYLDYFDGKLLNKPPFQDFKNGVYTFPTFILLNELPDIEAAKVHEILTSDTRLREDTNVQKEFLALLKQYEVDKKIIQHLKNIEENLLQNIRRFQNTPIRNKIEGQIQELMKL